jgi:hypothetical protein
MCSLYKHITDLQHKMDIRTRKRYGFSPPYNRDNCLIAKPLYSTTHQITYPYRTYGSYGHVTSNYKQQTPFIKPTQIL